jgi:hypothetical protein
MPTEKVDFDTVFSSFDTAAHTSAATFMRIRGTFALYFAGPENGHGYG